MFTSLIEQMKYKTLIEETLCEIENIFNEERSIPSEITNIINDIKYRLNERSRKVHLYRIIGQNFIER